MNELQIPTVAGAAPAATEALAKAVANPEGAAATDLALITVASAAADRVMPRWRRRFRRTATARSTRFRAASSLMPRTSPTSRNVFC